ncbi:hypothetical protein ABBQ38_003272 [Trebouxia sp. C0009 RCD-2024]
MVAVFSKLRRIDTAPNNRRGRQAWTFSSSGWLFVYFFGVIKCLRDFELHRDIYVVGSSGGACAGTYLFLDADIEATVEYVKRCAQKARTGWLAATRIRDYVAGAIDEFQPENAGPALNGNLEISVTTVPWFRNVRVKHFEDNTKVKNAILASACIVPPPLYLRGHGWAIDGAFSDFQILKALFVGGNFLTMHNEDAISVCPFYMSRADIKPSKWIPPWWAAYPPEPARLDELFELGYKDTFNWLRENRKIDPSGVPAGSHTSSQSVLSGSQTDSPRGSLTDSQSGSPLRSDLAGDRFFSSEADNTDGAHAEAEPLWRKLSCEAPSCDETFKEAFAGAWGLVRIVICYLLWFLICMELSVHSCVSFGRLAVTFLSRPVIGKESYQQSYQRFKVLCTSSTISSWELLKTVPKYSPQHIQLKDKRATQLRDNSFFFRLFYFILL